MLLLPLHLLDQTTHEAEVLSAEPLELPNPERQVVRLSEMLSSQAYADKASLLTLVLGMDIAGKPVVADLGKMPHVLVAGASGSDRSMEINTIILSLLYKATPQQVRLLLIGFRIQEFSVYDGIPHLLVPVVTDMQQATSALNWCVREMKKRYKLMSSLGVKNITDYNQKVSGAIKAGAPLINPFPLIPDTRETLEELPAIVVFIVELADLMKVCGNNVEELIALLTRKAHVSGIHLVLATQNPSVDICTGLIKSNVPVRVAFQVSSKTDSRTILDRLGAEELLGQGDMLYLSPGCGYLQHVQGAFVSGQEVHRVAEYLRARGYPIYIENMLTSMEEAENGDDFEGIADGDADVLYDHAVEFVVKYRCASVSLLQNHLLISGNRAERLVKQMAHAGVVTAIQENAERKVIASAVQA